MAADISVGCGRSDHNRDVTAVTDAVDERPVGGYGGVGRQTV